MNIYMLSDNVKPDPNMGQVFIEVIQKVTHMLMDFGRFIREPSEETNYELSSGKRQTQR
jgi:hypothetical protein